MPIQVAHIVPFASRIGGYERQARLLAAFQASIGLGVSIITHESDARRLAHDSPGVPIRSVNWRFGRARHRAIDQALGAADVLHVHAIDPFSACIILRARHHHIPAIVKVATQGDALHYADPKAHPPEVHLKRAFEPWRLRRQQRLMREAWSTIRQSQRFVALSTAIESELAGVGIPADRIVRLPNAVAIPSETVTIRPQARRAIYIGRLEERKRVHDLLHALQIVHATHPDAELHLVGEGSSRSGLECRASRVVFHGEVRDVSSLLLAADLFIFPSEREGCPNALLEAAAAGCPCIATRIAGIADWFDDRMLAFVDPRRPDSIADAWLELWNDAPRRCRLARSARDGVIATAAVEAIGRRYVALYEEMGRSAGCSAKPTQSDCNQQ